MNIKKAKEYDDGCKLEIRYTGIPKENVDLVKINLLLDKIVDNKYYGNNVPRIISAIRTILKDFEEKLLVVTRVSSNSTEIVKYDNGYLFHYELENEDKMSVCYDGISGLNFSFSKDIIDDYSKSRIATKQFSVMSNLIQYLKDIKGIKLDYDSNVLIEVYRLFYGENPDFSLQNINVRFQAMLSILAGFGISLGDYYSFLPGVEYCDLEKVNMPISLAIEQRVDSLFPLGEVTEFGETFTLTDEAKSIIENVGESIRESIKGSKNKDKALITLSNIIYERRYNLASSSDTEWLIKHTTCTPEEIKSTIKLLESVEKRVRKMNKQ